MIDEVSLAGVYMPALLVLGVVAVLLTGIISRLLTLLGAYRLVASRPLADLAIFVLILGTLSWLSASLGQPA